MFKKLSLALLPLLAVGTASSFVMAQAPKVKISTATVKNQAPNQCRYTVSGTVDNVGNNWRVLVEILDGTGAPVAPGSIDLGGPRGTWGSVWVQTCAGATPPAKVRARATLQEVPGLAALAVDTLDIMEVGPDVPSLTTYGFIVLALLLAGTAVWLFRRRLAMGKGGVA
jgi:hypothetical protein